MIHGGGDHIYIYIYVNLSLLVSFQYIRSIKFHPLINDLEFYDNCPTQPGSSGSLLRTTQAPTKNRGDCVCKQGNFLHWNTKVHRCGWSWKNRATIVASKCRGSNTLSGGHWNTVSMFLWCKFRTLCKHLGPYWFPTRVCIQHEPQRMIRECNTNSVRSMDLFTRNASLKSPGALSVAFSHGNSRIEFARSGWECFFLLKSRMVLPERLVMDVSDVAWVLLQQW